MLEYKRKIGPESKKTHIEGPVLVAVYMYRSK